VRFSGPEQSALKQAAAKTQDIQGYRVALAFNQISPNGLIQEFIDIEWNVR
jgi:hypothetical protein